MSTPMLQPKLAQMENHETTMHKNLNTTIWIYIHWVDIYMGINYASILDIFLCSFKKR